MASQVAGGPRPQRVMHLLHQAASEPGRFTVSIARRLGPGHRVVTIQVDRGLKYLAGQLYS